MIPPISSGLIGYFPLRGKPNDFCCNNGIKTTSTLIYAQRRGRIGLKCSSTYIDLNTTVMASRSKGTVALWMMPTSLPSTQQMFLYQEGSSHNAFTFGLNPNAISAPYALFANLGSNTYINGTYNTWVVGNWYHVAVTWNGSAVIFYVNGVTDRINTNSSGSDGAVSGKTCIGSYDTGGTFGNYATGILSDLFMFNRALTAEEISILYNTPYQIFLPLPTLKFVIPLLPRHIISGSY